MPGKVLIENRLHEDLKKGKESRKLNEYCKALGWDCKKLQLSLVCEGIKDETLYLDEPNGKFIDTLARFLLLSEPSILVIYSSAGLGKTSAKDFVTRTLNSSDDFYISAVNGSGKTFLQLLKGVLRDLSSANKTPRNLDFVWKKLMMAILELKEAGITTVIWVDDAEKLESGDLLILRSLAEARTFSGEKACKIVLAGTPSLKKKTDNLLEWNPFDKEEMEANRAFFCLELKKWNADHIFRWWELLSKFCSTTGKASNPFSGKAAERVLEFSEGIPWDIMRLTRHVLFEKASKYRGNESDARITEDDVLNSVSNSVSTT
ncbi:AAA family ATPase [Methanosarcina sp. Mfa9]|uniref:AAA family ATPase n=1 Tax=Methanosarcina sp. Mfa9 TaxID=3439063 RepID=UPI003F83C1DB